jgi:hypothetical protein
MTTARRRLSWIVLSNGLWLLAPCPTQLGSDIGSAEVLTQCGVECVHGAWIQLYPGPRPLGGQQRRIDSLAQGTRRDNMNRSPVL